MSFGIDNRKLKKFVDLYRPNNHAEEMKYLMLLKGEQDLFINLETCPFQGISTNSIEDRKTTYGTNQLIYQKRSTFAPLKETITEPWVFMSVFLSLFCFILEVNGAGTGEGLRSMFMVSVAILNWILLSLQRFWFQKRSQKIAHMMKQNMTTVVRENRQQKISGSQIVVGDMLEIKEGDVIPADGWLIQGQDITVSEPFVTGYIETRKCTFRDCLLEMKEKIGENKNESQQVISQCSPALIGGSLVQTGFGRMIVLCVGDLSRQGALLSSSQLKYKENYCRSKVHKLANEIGEKLIIFNLIFTALYIMRLAYEAYSSSSWELLLSEQDWKYLIAVLWVMVIGLPQGLQLGLMVGLWFLKFKLYFSNKIWVDYCEDMTKMANVNLICFDKKFQRGRTIYREWWNQQIHQFNHQTIQDEKEVQDGSAQQNIDDNLCEEFKELFEYTSLFKECKQPHQYYVPHEEMTMNVSQVGMWEIFEDTVCGNDVKYVCQNDLIKYVLMALEVEDEQKIFLVMGIGQDMVQKCSTLLSTSKGQIKQLRSKDKNKITQNIENMNRKFMSTTVMAYFTVNKGSQTQINEIELLKKVSLTFLCLIGSSGIKEHSQYQVAHRIREAGVKLMIVSSCQLEEAILRSKYIGVNALEQETLALKGSEYVNLVGDVQCSDCKKSICTCQVKFNLPKVKNLAQLKHVQRSFRVVGEASAENKYALMVGLDNIDYDVAYMGYGSEDMPALAHSYLSISVGSELTEGYSVSVNKNQINNLSKLMLWSRFSHQFIKKYLQLIIPTSIVQIVVMLIGVMTCKQIIIGIFPLTWVCVVICPILALALAWQRPSQTLMSQSSRNYHKDSQVLSGSMKKQIVSQIIWQCFILLAVIFTGHLWIPQSSDIFDESIGSDWSAKYSTSDKNLIANGLFTNPLIDSLSYSTAYNQYSVNSRHLTVVFNVFALMQIFNCLNCRKIKDRLINILEGIQIQTVIILTGTFIMHLLFVLLSGDGAGLYPYGLTLIQWFISIGLAATVWIISFIARLMPEPSSITKHRQSWVNRSINLGVKLVGKNSNLAEYQIQEQIQLKNL